jgi:hypothetical protein
MISLTKMSLSGDFFVLLRDHKYAQIITSTITNAKKLPLIVKIEIIPVKKMINNSFLDPK